MIQIFFLTSNFSYITSKDWNDWFSIDYDRRVVGNQDLSLKIRNNTYISHSFFLDVLAAVKINKFDKAIHLCVEDSTFISCYNISDGGAINYNSKGQCIFYRVCGNQCFSTATIGWGQFCYCTSFNSSLISVCQCPANHNHENSASLCLEYGTISLSSSNSSNNRCYRYSGILIWEPIKSICSFTSFSSNNDSHSRPVGFGYQINDLKHCNIIQNHYMLKEYGTIRSYDANTNLLNCIINLNTGTNYVLCCDLGSMSLHSCYLQTDMPIFGNINIQNPLSYNEINDITLKIDNQCISHLKTAKVETQQFHQLFSIIILLLLSSNF